MSIIKIENKHIVIKKSDLDKNDLLKLKCIQDRAAMVRKEDGRQGYPEYVVVNKDEEYYPAVMQMVIEGEVKKANKKYFDENSIKILSQMVMESPEQIKSDLEKDNYCLKVAKETANYIDEFILEKLNLKVDEFHVQIDGVDFLRCPDCGKYREVQYPESFMFNVARLACNCGFKFEIPSETKAIAFGKLKRFVGHKNKGKMGVKSLE